jgi:hypothetical protein
LPGEVRRGGPGDVGAQIVVYDVPQGAHDLRWQRAGRGNRARTAPLRGAFDGRERAHAETQLAHGDPTLAQSFADGFGQQGQLVRPHAGRHTEDEHAVVERDGMRSVGDARADRIPP